MSDHREGKLMIEILLVEDNPGDVRLTVEAFREGKIDNKLNVVGDGEEAMAFLRHEGKYVQSSRPDLILLDLNLPRKDGREMLAEIKADKDLKRIPVVVLTTSKAEEDIFRTYDLGANSFIVKPVSFEGLVEVMEALRRYWFEIVEIAGDGHNR